MHSVLEEMKHHTCHLKLLLYACLDTEQFFKRKKYLHQSSYGFHCLFLHKDNSFLDEMEFELTILQFRGDSILHFYNDIYFIVRAKGENNYNNLVHYFNLNQDKCDICNFKKSKVLQTDLDVYQ